MTHQEQSELVTKYRWLNAARDTAAAEELLTDASPIANPSYMALGGMYCGKGAFRKLFPLVRQIVAGAGPVSPGGTSGEDQAVEISEFALERETQLAKLARLRGNQICEIRPYQSDPKLYVDAAAPREAQ